MSQQENHLETRLREVLKQHQRDGLSMVGNVDRLVGTLARAVQDWIEETRVAEKKSA